jgi:hypothetical protein
MDYADFGFNFTEGRKNSGLLSCWAAGGRRERFTEKKKKMKKKKKEKEKKEKLWLLELQGCRDKEGGIY